MTRDSLSAPRTGRNVPRSFIRGEKETHAVPQVHESPAAERGLIKRVVSCSSIWHLPCLISGYEPFAPNPFCPKWKCRGAPCPRWRRARIRSGGEEEVMTATKDMVRIAATGDLHFP